MENTCNNFDIFHILQLWIYASSKLIKYYWIQKGCCNSEISWAFDRRNSKTLSIIKTRGLHVAPIWARLNRRRHVYGNKPQGLLVSSRGRPTRGNTEIRQGDISRFCLAVRRSRYRFPIYRDEWCAGHDRPIAGILHACSHFRNLKEKTYYRAANVGCGRAA